MPNFHRDYKRDFAEIERALRDGEPFCFVRFNDGEFALLHGHTYKAASGWKVQGSRRVGKKRKELWIRDPLFASLRANVPGYHIGISAPCCLPKLVLFYRREVQIPPVRATFASLFFNANYAKAMRLFRDFDGLTVGSGKDCDYRIPADAVNKEWDIDALVDKLLEEADKPILLAAGPSSCIIGHRYWERAIERQTQVEGFRPQTILDIGATIDVVLHGHRTRIYHDAASPLRGHVCQWEHLRVHSGLAPANTQKQGHIIHHGAAAPGNNAHVISHGPSPSAMQHRGPDIAVEAQAAPTIQEHRAKLKEHVTKPASGKWTRQQRLRRRKRR